MPSRYLLIAMFNLSIGDDDDGKNAAGGRRPYRPSRRRPALLVQQRPSAMDERIDGDTGEVIERPFAIQDRDERRLKLRAQFLSNRSKLAPFSAQKPSTNGMPGELLNQDIS